MSLEVRKVYEQTDTKKLLYTQMMSINEKFLKWKFIHITSYQAIRTYIRTYILTHTHTHTKEIQKNSKITYVHT